MKKILMVVGTGLFAASLFAAEPTPVLRALETKPVTTKTTVPPTKPAPKKLEVVVEEPKIPGTTIPRANGTFLGLEVVGGNFKLSFYDKKKKLMPIDVTRATARWPNKKAATAGDNRTVLNGSGTALVGAKPVVPPLVFNVYITLLQGEGDGAKAVETYVVPFHD